MNIPLSSQSLAALTEWTEEFEETELRLSIPNSRGSFFIAAIFDCLGLVAGLRDFEPERISSNLRGRARR